MDNNQRKKFEEILDRNAKNLMSHYWNIKNFKKTHPTLFKVFLSSMAEVNNDQLQKEKENGTIITIKDLEAVQELLSKQGPKSDGPYYIDEGDGWVEFKDSNLWAAKALSLTEAGIKFEAAKKKEAIYYYAGYDKVHTYYSPNLKNHWYGTKKEIIEYLKTQFEFKDGTNEKEKKEYIEHWFNHYTTLKIDLK